MKEYKETRIKLTHTDTGECLEKMGEFGGGDTIIYRKSGEINNIIDTTQKTSVDAMILRNNLEIGVHV